MHDMIEELGDDASSFVSPERAAYENSIYESLEIRGGIGAAVSEQDGEAILVRVMPGYPADEAGLRPGERLVSVDGTASEELPLGVIPAIVGEAGTQLELTVRSLEGKQRNVTLTRETVDLSDAAVQATTIEGTRIGLLDLASFESPEIPGRVRNSLEDLAKDGALDGLILDMRTHQGGYGDVALGVLTLFLDGGSAGRSVSRDEVFEIEIPAGETVPELVAVPMVVLTGPHTLGVAEGFAAIMQHHGRAQIVGLPTRGNMEGVAAFALSDGSKLWLAEAVYQLPDGTMFEGRGVRPDLVVEGDPWQYDVGDDPQIRAAIEALRSD
jgi:carboxyl-terminal processing protease